MTTNLQKQVFPKYLVRNTFTWSQPTHHWCYNAHNQPCLPLIKGNRKWTKNGSISPVIYDNRVCRCQVNSQAPSPGRKQKTKPGRIFGIKSIYAYLSLSPTNLAIYPLILPFLKTERVWTRKILIISTCQQIMNCCAVQNKNIKGCKQTNTTIVPYNLSNLLVSPACAGTVNIWELYGPAL